MVGAVQAPWGPIPFQRSLPAFSHVRVRHYVRTAFVEKTSAVYATIRRLELATELATKGDIHNAAYCISFIEHSI